MKKIGFILLGLCITFASCGNMSDEKIEKTISSGVVLVQNQSYYEVELADGLTLYFTSYDESDGIKGLVFDEDSIEYQTAYGTGFFVSEDGEIPTNAHVVANIVEDKSVNKSVAKVIAAMKEYVSDYYDDLDEEYQQAQMAYEYARVTPEVSYDTFYQIGDYCDNLKGQMNLCVTIYRELDDLRASDSEIRYHNRVSIAYNDTYVENTSDFISCVVKETDLAHDLALIQIKDKKTPEGKYVFTVGEDDPLEQYSLGEKLGKTFGKDKNSSVFMASYNLGPVLAITDEGIKSQFNSGTISQKTKNKVMYSIPTLPGSSGSPVVNKRGQLVAVNYAGLSNTQSFNYGIRVKYLVDLMDR